MILYAKIRKAERKYLTELEGFKTMKYAIIMVFVNDSAQIPTLRYYENNIWQYSKNTSSSVKLYFQPNEQNKHV